MDTISTHNTKVLGLASYKKRGWVRVSFVSEPKFCAFETKHTPTPIDAGELDREP